MIPFRELFNSLSVGLVLADNSGRILLVNDKALSIYSCDDPSGLFLWDFIHSFDRTLNKSLLKTLIKLSLRTGVVRTEPIYRSIKTPAGAKNILFNLRAFKFNGKRYLFQTVTETSNELFNSDLLALYRKGFKGSPNSRLIVDYLNNEPHILMVNNSFTKIYGYKSGEVIGKNPNILKSGLQSRDYYKRMWSSLLNPKKGYWHDEIINKRKDGSLVNVILTINTLFDKHGKPLLFTAHHVDITKLKIAEKELMVKDSLIEATLNSTRDGLLAVSADWSVITYNEQFVKMWGLPKKLLSMNNDQLLIRYAAKKLINHRGFLKRIKDLMSNPDESTDLLYFKDGRIIERYGEPLIINGVIRGRVWSFRDITSVVVYEQELRNETNKLKTYINASGLIVLITDKRGVIRIVNDACLKLSGYTTKELINHKWTKLLLTADKRLINKELFEARLLNTKGEVRLIVWRRKVVNNEVLLIGEDVTEKRAREEELNRLRDKERLEKMKREFLLLITHELKQPLTPIMGYADLLKEDIVNVEQLKYIDKIIMSAQEMYDLVNKIVNLMKIETGQLMFNFTRISLTKLINESLRKRASMINLKNIVIKKAVKESLFTGDYNLLRDVVVNLIDNAIKFSKEHGLIEVKARPVGGKIVISVKDHGVGIRKEDIPKLFKTFSQTIEGRKKGGFGIGLSLCKMIIDRHHGSISVKSVYGKGSEFIIKLPRVVK